MIYYRVLIFGIFSFVAFERKNLFFVCRKEIFVFSSLESSG